MIMKTNYKLTNKTDSSYKLASTLENKVYQVFMIHKINTFIYIIN